jgi:hypothetical protein
LNSAEHDQMPKIGSGQKGVATIKLNVKEFLHDIKTHKPTQFINYIFHFTKLLLKNFYKKINMYNK